MVKQYFSVAELLEMQIPYLPKYRPHLIAKAKKENWKSRPKSGKGGGFEYCFTSLPQAAQDYILNLKSSSCAEIVEAQKREIVQKQATMFDNLLPYQREMLEARAIILTEIEALAQLCGINNAIEKFKEQITNETLSPETKNALLKANGKSGNKLKISRATIFNWRKAVKDAGTTLALTSKEMPKAEWPEWGDILLKFWQQPQKPSLQYCLDKLCENFPVAKCPSYSAAQRFIKKLPAQIREKGRLGTREIKKIKAYVIRDTSNLWPTAVYTADGHTFDAEVEHPFTGKPFRPEITTVIDVFTRKVVGWSIDLNERTNSVYAALAKSIKTHGVPAIWYVDNGKGFNNKFFDNSVVGLLARLNIRKENSIAYNSQARGIGERIHRTIWVRAAKELPTYMGADMDPQAKQAVFKKTRHDIATIGGSKLLMKWSDFITFCQNRVDWYNNKEHSSLPIMVDAQTYKKRHYTPTEFWNKAVENGFTADRITLAEAENLNKFFEIRKVIHSQLTWCNNFYTSPLLQSVDSQEVAICYDPTDPKEIDVYTLHIVNGEKKLGTKICKAQLFGTKTGYFPQSAFEHRDVKRLTGKIKRLQKHVEEAEDEYKNSLIEAPIQTDLEEFTSLVAEPKPAITEESIPVVKTTTTGRPLFINDMTMINWLLSHPKEITVNDKNYLDNLIQKPEYISLLDAEDISVESVKTLIKTA